MFSLWKTFLEIIISIYLVVIKSGKAQQLERELAEYDREVIKQKSTSYYLMRKLILIRRKIRFHQMEVFIYLMRMIMLIYSLKLAGHKILHPIFVSICGLLQAITVVFKSMKGKKKFYKLTKAEITTAA
jgi:hypothetical protein